MTKERTFIPLLLRAGLLPVAALVLAACSGSGSGPVTNIDADTRKADAYGYFDEPRYTLNARVENIELPQTVEPVQAAALKSTAVKSAATVVDPTKALKGSPTENPFTPKGLPYTLVDGVRKPVPTNKWYKGFLYQSPRDLTVTEFEGVGQTQSEQAVFAFPNRLFLDDRSAMINVAFPRRFYLKPGSPDGINNDFKNPYLRDIYLYPVISDPDSDVFITSAAPVAGGRNTELKRTVEHLDELMATTAWYNSDKSKSMKLLSAVGSPYVTVTYKGLVPQLGFGQSIVGQWSKDQYNNNTARVPGKWEVVNNLHAVSAGTAFGPQTAQKFQERGGDKATPDLTGTKFRFVYNNPDQYYMFKPNPSDADHQFSQRVAVVYTSSPITFKWDAPTRTYVASAPFTGTVRVAFVDDQQSDNLGTGATTVAFATREAILDVHADEYPLESDIRLDYRGGATGTVTYDWTTRKLNGSAGTGNLLMMAFNATHGKNLPGDVKIPQLTYRSNFGWMTGVRGKSWTQTLTIPEILQAGTNAKNKELVWHGNGTIKEGDKKVIFDSLVQDLTTYKTWVTNFNYNSYDGGKYIGNLARMALIADQMEDYDEKDAAGIRNARKLRAEIVDFIKRNLYPWFNATDPTDCGSYVSGGSAASYETNARNLTPQITGCVDKKMENGGGWNVRVNAKGADYFRYDTTYGGTVTNLPFANNDPGMDYFNPRYLDHMFHYGYYIYAAAVVARFDDEWRTTYKDAVDTLVRDIANIDGDDAWYPQTRTYDWFRMQNVADAGPDANGGNTESSSEALHSGYAMVLWGAANNDTRLQGLATLMLTGEIGAAQAFYQVTPASNVFSDAAPVTINNITFPDKSVGSLTLDPAQLVTWGIKYANQTLAQTFFAALEYTLVGIQVLPITPISEYVFSKDWLKHHQAGLMNMETKYSKQFSDMGTDAAIKMDAMACGQDKDLTMILNEHSNPGSSCAGQARVLWSWRGLLTSVNALNDPAAAWNRYYAGQDSYMTSLPTWEKTFRSKTAGTPYIADGKQQTWPEAGVNPDVLKDISTPTTNSNVLWWLSTRKP